MVGGRALSTVRGVDDTANMARIDRLMADDPGMTERQAILVIDPEEGNVRRLQKKLQIRRETQAADLRRSVCARHAEAYPVAADEQDGDLRLSVRMPLPGPGDAGDSVTVVVEVDAGGGRGRASGLSCNVVVTGMGVQRSPFPGPMGGLRALGLASRPVGGVLVDDEASDAVRLLSTVLRDAWVGAGLPPGDDLLRDAWAHEAARLGDGGLDRVRNLMGADGRRIAACYHEAPAGLLSTVLTVGPDPARRAVLRDLSAFGGTDLAATDPDLVAAHVGRPVELLVHVLRKRQAGPGRAVDLSDAIWLHGLMGRRALPPVPDRVLGLLLRVRGSVDPARCPDDADAAGLVAILDAVPDMPVSSVAGVDVALDMVLARIGSGPDGTLPYGTVAARLRHAGGGSLARALTLVTSGVEALHSHVVAGLLVPTVVMDALAHDGTDPGCLARALSSVLDSAPWRSRFDRQAREMLESGRDLAQLADAVMRLGDPEPCFPGHDVTQRSVAEAVARWSSARSRCSDLDAAWDSLSPGFVPRWRIGGRRAWADRTRPSVREALAGQDLGGGAIRRGLRTIVDRVEANLGMIEDQGVRHERLPARHVGR